MKQSHTDEDIEKVKEKAIQQGHEPLVIYGVERSVVAVSGKVNDDHRAVMKLLPNVSRVIPVGKPYKLASKNYKKENSIIQIQNLTIGGDESQLLLVQIVQRHRNKQLKLQWLQRMQDQMV